jgi:hypothetical protein
LAWTRKAPTDGSTHWSTRKLAKALKLSSHTFVQRARRRAGLQPDRLDQYLRSTDPAFETKAADFIRLCLDRVQHAAVFCLDEKRAIQALVRLDPCCLSRPAAPSDTGSSTTVTARRRSMRPSNTRTGEVVGQTSVRRTSDAFLAFLAQVVNTQPRRREIHIILDNLATHKTQRVRTFLAAHPWVHLHFTPTYSS